MIVFKQASINRFVLNLSQPEIFGLEVLNLTLQQAYFITHLYALQLSLIGNKNI